MEPRSRATTSRRRSQRQRSSSRRAPAFRPVLRFVRGMARREQLFLFGVRLPRNREVTRRATAAVPGPKAGLGPTRSSCCTRRGGAASTECSARVGRALRRWAAHRLDGQLHTNRARGADRFVHRLFRWFETRVSRVGGSIDAHLRTDFDFDRWVRSDEAYRLGREPSRGSTKAMDVLVFSARAMSRTTSAERSRSTTIRTFAVRSSICRQRTIRSRPR